MKKMLVVNGCVRGRESRTWMLAQGVLDQIQILFPEYGLTQLNLNAIEPQYLTRERLLYREQCRERGLHEDVFAMAHEFAEADRILIAAPFWDLSIPAIVKAYLENVSVDGITFYCDESGMHGKSKADKMLYVTTRGDVYSGTDMEQGFPYLFALCRMFGIPECRCYAAEGLDLVQNDAETIMKEARSRAKEYALWLATDGK